MNFEWDLVSYDTLLLSGHDYDFLSKLDPIWSKVLHMICSNFTDFLAFWTRGWKESLCSGQNRSNQRIDFHSNLNWVT